MGTPGHPLPAQDLWVSPEWAKTVTHTQRKYTERDTPAEDANPAAGRLLKALGLSNLNAVFPASCAG